MPDASDLRILNSAFQHDAAGQATARPEWPGGNLCAHRKPAVSPWLVAGLILAALTGRFTLALAHAEHPFVDLSWMACALALGGCLWWVAHRQAGLGGASVALALYVSTPTLLHSGFNVLTALGLFAMLYTAVGVAHALQGPRHKWMPRILLMAALSAFTAAAQPSACALGLLLAFCAMLYLAQGKRSLLPFLLALWIASAFLAWWLSGFLPWRVPVASGSGFLLNTGSNWAHPWHHTGIFSAVCAALLLWFFAQRSRYFGNTAPLLAAFLLLSSEFIVGPASLLWALPFLLLFVGGVFADGLETRFAAVWVFLAVAMCFLQAFVPR